MSNVPSKSQLLIYQSDDGTIKIDVRFEKETVWLTQPLMAKLFQTTQQNISLHLQNIYEEGELGLEATHKKILSVRREGNRDVQRQIDFYNLTHAGKISHELALNHAEQEYGAFHGQRIAENADRPDDFEKSIQQLPAAKPKRKKKGGKR